MGTYRGERIDRAEFDAMLTRFYEISNLAPDGLPRDEWRGELERMMG